jgi:hypothetical protein
VAPKKTEYTEDDDASVPFVIGVPINGKLGCPVGEWTPASIDSPAACIPEEQSRSKLQPKRNRRNTPTTGKARMLTAPECQITAGEAMA